MKFIKKSLFVLLAGSFALSAACGGGTDDLDDAKKNVGDACEKTADCNDSSLVCKENQCAKKDGGHDHDNVTGTVEKNGMCEANATEPGKKCKEGLKCESEVCVEDGGAETAGKDETCSDTIKCETGLTCEDSAQGGKKCVDKTVNNKVGKDHACGDGVECNDGLYCDTTCKDQKRIGETCSSDAMCLGGDKVTCDGNECKAAYGGNCTDQGGECATGLKCEAKLCKVAEAGECSDEMECAAGLECGQPTGTPPKRTCSLAAQPHGGACTADDDCQSGLTCDSNVCKGAAGSACDATNTCATNLQCENSQCIVPTNGTCEQNTDCGDNDYCGPNLATPPVKVCQNKVDEGDACTAEGACTEATHECVETAAGTKECQRRCASTSDNALCNDGTKTDCVEGKKVSDDTQAAFYCAEPTP